MCATKHTRMSSKKCKTLEMKTPNFTMSCEFRDRNYLDRDQPIRLIVSPGACYLPNDLHIWGWSAQLYALRSSKSWGMGDFSDLQRLARWSAKEHGARVLLVNPLQTASPVTPQQASPYFPSSRRYRNLLYL